MEYDLESGPWDPITGVVSSCLGMVGNMTKSLGDVPIAVSRANKAHPINGNVARRSLNVAQGTVVGTSKGVGRILLAGFRSPFEVMLMAARGFHNVPALYGDDSVRSQERITGMVSGFEAMGKVRQLIIWFGDIFDRNRKLDTVCTMAFRACFCIQSTVLGAKDSLASARGLQRDWADLFSNQ
jgi:hypothetical protein